jgi:hypothetical protein
VRVDAHGRAASGPELGQTTDRAWSPWMRSSRGIDVWTVTGSGKCTFVVTTPTPNASVARAAAAPYRH